MRVGFVYDIRENVFATSEDRRLPELTTELFSASQANSIITALKDLGHQVLVIDGAAEFARNVTSYKKDIDFVFNEAKGLFGPDRKMVVPALCRIHGIPYLGSDAYAVTLARNKWHTLAVSAAAGVAVPESTLFWRGDDEDLNAWDCFPAIIKPNFESSSIGITENSVVSSRTALRERVATVIETYHQPVLVQRFVPGVEIQISIAGNARPRVLGTVELHVTRDGIPSEFIINADWPSGNVRFVACANPAVEARASLAAIRVYRALGISDYGRIDFRYDSSGSFYFIEAATHPHILPDSSFFIAASRCGLGFSEMIDTLMQAAQERYATQGASPATF